MPGVVFGSSKLLLKNNAYIENKLDIGRTANEKCNAYIVKKLDMGRTANRNCNACIADELDIGRITVGKGTAPIGHTLI